MPTSDRTKPTSPSGGHPARQVLYGRNAGGLQIARQAYRVRDDETDELLVLHRGRDVWVAGRFGDRTAVWAHHDLDAAEDAFERLTPPDDGWLQAQPADPALRGAA